MFIKIFYKFVTFMIQFLDKYKEINYLLFC
jgi:hypothetical protein